MAKKNVGRLAGLAALAGAAYMMSKGKDATGPAATAAEKDASDARTKAQREAVSGAKKVGSDETKLQSPAESIAAADKSDKSTSISTKGAAGTTTPGPDTSVPNLAVTPAVTPAVSPAVTPANTDKKPLKVVSEPDDKRVKLSSDAAVLEALNSRGNRSVKNDNYSNEGRNAKNKQIPVLPLGSSDTKTYDRKKGATAGGINAYRKEQEEKERIKKLRASGGRRAAGGAIKKMASGGMTASRRGDGIASRGKTRCKMY